jgi:hypothetical protein
VGQRNLKDNGGLLDEVIFAVRTEIPEDLEYLDILLQSHPHYRKHVETQSYDWYIGSWEAVNEENSIYIKIDDDTVRSIPSGFAPPSAGSRVLTSGLGILRGPYDPSGGQTSAGEPTILCCICQCREQPSPLMGPCSLGRLRTLLSRSSPPHSASFQSVLPADIFEEMTAPEYPPPPSWRASELPTYTGPLEGPDNFTIDGASEPPYEGHRWLPVRPPRGSNFDLGLTPASTITYDAFGPGSLRSWATAAQTHYSFLQHLEQGETGRYKFDTWDFQYQRLSINFLAVRGKDIMDAFPFPQPDDESYLTERRPRETNRRVVVDGTALAVHYAFNPQYMAHGGKGLTWTDVLPRYAAYAQEMICPGIPS